ncbi:MAG: hypothetical protein ACI4EU_02960 [Butyrivibrio sp.]
MTTKKYLSQISRLNRMINNKLSEIAELRSLSMSISAIQTGERVQTSPEPDRIGSNLAKIDELERKTDELIDDYVNKRDLIISQIDGIDNELFYDILFSRYIEKKPIEEIAVKISYSYRNTKRLHNRALKEFEQKYGNTYLEK